MNKKVCPKCGKNNDSDSTFCIYCGADLSEKVADENQKPKEENGLIKCPSCGTLNSSDLFYCKKCGADLKGNQSLAVAKPEDGKFCPKCGTKNPADSHFCINCGHDLNLSTNDQNLTCPYCGSNDLQLVVYDESQDFNPGPACCGLVACGLPGLLFGLVGNKKSKRYVHRCKKCGHEF